MADQGFGLPAPLPAFSGWRRWGLPGSWRTFDRMPCFSDSGGPTDARPIQHPWCCLPTPRTGSASTKSDFGALHTAYALAVYASPLRLPSRRKTRFRLAATLGRTGLIPARSVRKVSKTPLSSLTHVISSPFPRLSLAHTWHPSVEEELAPIHQLRPAYSFHLVPISTQLSDCVAQPDDVLLSRRAVLVGEQVSTIQFKVILTGSSLLAVELTDGTCKICTTSRLEVTVVGRPARSSLDDRPPP